MAKVLVFTIVSSLYMHAALWSCAMSQVCENEYVSVYTEKMQTAMKEVIDGIQSAVFEDPAIEDEANQTALYSALSKAHNITESSKGLKDFTVALDAITNAYFVACYGFEENQPTAQDGPELVQEFLTLLATSSDIFRMREIFGQLTCLKNFSTNNAIKKRDATIMLLTKCGGKTSLKNLYECLNESLQQCIFSLSGSCTEDQANAEKLTSCIGFVVDTTGSMGEEIDDARTVITNLVQSEANNNIRCYVLVGFNDYDDTDDLYNSKYACMEPLKDPL